MDTHDDLTTPLPAEESNVPAVATRHSGRSEHSEGQWINVAEPLPAAPAAAFNIYALLHAFRRNWLLASALGLVCCIITGVLVYFYVPGARYKSTAYLRLSEQMKSTVPGFRTADMVGTLEFDIFKNTQTQLVKNPFVMADALDNPEVIKFKPENQPDYVGWLTDKIQVSTPGKAEIMEVSATSSNPPEAAALVNAVVASYLKLFVYKEITERNDRLKKINGIVDKATEELRNERNTLKNLAEQSGASDEKGASLRQTIAIDQFNEYQRQYMRMEFEMQRADAQLKALEAQIQSINDMDVNAFELDRYGREDPQMRSLVEDLYWRKMDNLRTQQITKADAKSQWVKNQSQEFAMIQKEYNDKVEEMKKGVRALKIADIEKDRLKAKAEKESLERQMADYKDKVAEKQNDAKKLTSSSVDMKMQLAKIDQLETMLKNLSDERQKLKVEIDTESRIKPLQDSVGVPLSESQRPLRILASLLSASLALCLPVGLIVAWDLRGRRISTSAQVSRELGFSVMGSVPVIPARAVRRAASPSRRSQNWHLRLTESIDGIAARFHRRATLQNTRVILITSASSGEGKTTLATQLALSFARNGRRTVLVDFDLRRPALDAVFGLPPEPGVCDLLRGEEDSAPLIHPTATDNLSVVTAGRWDRPALAALANGGARVILEKLRAEYDFVVIDSSPILPVADTRFISQHADAVVLSVFRDVSQAPKVQAAGEILEAFGVRTLEVVITGAGDGQTGREMGYESRASA
jgi:polysaccharide biosynthesis transport protein